MVKKQLFDQSQTSVGETSVNSFYLKLTIKTDGIKYTKLLCGAPEKDVDGGSSNGFLSMWLAGCTEMIWAPFNDVQKKKTYFIVSRLKVKFKNI